MKKILSLLMLLVTIVSGARADSYTLGFADETVNSCNGSYAAGTATFTCGSDVFTITNTNEDPSKVKTNSDANYTSDVKRYGVKYSQNVVFTVNIPDGISIKSVTFSGWANSVTSTTQINKINDADVTGETGNSFGTKGAYDSWTYEFATAQTGSFTFVNKGAEGVFNITLTTESAPATKPTITQQPQGATYVIDSEDYPSMSVEATASAGDLKYQWHIILPTTGDYTIPGANAATLSLATYATQMAAYLSQEGAYSIYCNVADDNDNVDSDMATLTVTATAPVTPADPTFDKADGASMKAGDVITVTSSEGSTIYYRWSGKSGQTWTPEAFKDGRTPYDSPCTTTTSTKGDRYVYAMAEINGNYSNITSIKVTVSENPVKGQLDKTSDAVDQNAEAPAVPVFTLVDADGNPSSASMGAEGSTKDIFVKYVVTGTEGIINLNSDATAIESISTATAGTATATITITQNKDAYPIIDGEGTYTYTITVSEGSGPTPPAAGPTITTQPQNVTYVIGSETCDNMTIVAEPATEGDALAYEWQYSLNGETFEAIPALFVPSATTSTLIGTEAIALINNLDPKPEKAFIRCIVSEIGANDAISNVATVTLQAPASYSESVNIEQLVLDNGVKYDIANEFVKKYIEYASLNALDSLNDADGKVMRNEPFLGLKLKTAGAYIKVTLKQGSSLKVKLGNIGDNVKVNINGTEQEDIVKMTTKDASYMTTVYEYTADDADAVVTFTTSSAGTVVFKQIMIDEEIAQVILPYAVDMPAAPANGTVEMPASANPGDEVTIVATPDDGYELDAITVTGKSTNNAYEVSADNTFTMPEENVNVTVTFKQITGINNVNANDNANSDAKVKVIKNGKLYIGNYNISGQQVK